MSVVDHRALDRAGARFVYVMGALAREATSGKVPGPGLAQVNEAAWRLVELVGAVRIVVDASGAFVNNCRIHVPEGLHPMRDLLAEAFSERGVGGVSVEGVAEVKEWTAVARVLFTAPQSGGDASDRLNALLGVGPLRFLPLTRHAVPEIDEGEVTDFSILRRREEATAQWALSLYTRCCHAMAVIWAGGTTTRLPGLVQELVELSEDSPRHLMALVAAAPDVPYELSHPVNTAILSTLLGRQLGMHRGVLLELGLCALACDVGMRHIPRDLLRKTQALTRDETARIQRHPLDSALEAMAVPDLDAAACRRIRACLEQHMEPKGEGYPALPDWGDLHLFSRIIGVADRYDALVSPQRAQPRLLPDRALGQMVSGSEPALVAQFVATVGRYPVGTVVLLQTGEVAVVQTPPQSPEQLVRPRVRLLTPPSGGQRRVDDVVDLRDKTPAGVYRRTIVRSVDAQALGVDVLSALFGQR